ncbi:GNAT family N-acetyltransferase [Fictibacillus nanhaiensis]|uniref:aminoglycoside 6'-N-acetyltransferase n=1 Tax=Fictibacillus nanhaiensis TaxID=742169 RepID=UPI001C94ED6D|nr:aminoglycoside 6'-N-acetyltransferase [Fictibacillus nanhaiensis]MBY6035823.1 GNAT family N-acetyltransferase [Fictibacillus nanhaiensis]
MGLIIAAKEMHLNNLTKMGKELWPENDFNELKSEFLNLLHSDKDKLFLFLKNEEPIGFIHVSIRSDYVEGAISNPTGFVEGVYVRPDLRRKGVSKKLLKEGEEWLKTKGCKQIGSDIELENEASYKFHTNVGFKEVNRIIAFIKDIH